MDRQITSREKRDSVKRDYDIIADEYSAEFGRLYEDIEVVEEFISKLKPDSNILDLGGGTGKLTDLFIRKGYRAICYDFSKEMMRKSREYYSNLPYILDDMLNMEEHFDSNTFDGVIAFYSLFHVPREDLKNVFSSIRKVLKDDGIFCFVVQLGNGEQFIDEPYLKEKGKGVLYFNFFTKDLINEMLINNNFEILYEIEKNEVGENELGEDGNNKVFVIARKRKEGREMKDNYFIIHGSFGSPFGNWFSWLRKQLEDRNCEVYTPDFPIGVGYQNYENWSKLLKVYLDAGLINENTTIIAHSIAPIFISKFLVENKVLVKKLIFVCGFNNYLGINEEYDAVNNSMYFDNLSDVKQYAKDIICYYSDNDPYVKYEAEKQFADTIATEQILLNNAGHINAESGYTKFNEILDILE